MPVKSSSRSLMKYIQRLRGQKPVQTGDLSARRMAHLRERLIQLLALKPFTKPELYARLNSDGIKEKERSAVSQILPQISSLTDNRYHLLASLWKDVDAAWPAYSEEERRIIERRKPQNLSPSANKRLSAAGAPDELPAKRQRTEHCRPPAARSNADQVGPSAGGDVADAKPLQDTRLSSEAVDGDTTDSEDLERQYPPVTNPSTRRAYKREFAELYEEYRSLHERLDEVAAMFTSLEQQLQPHSPDRQSIEQRILEESRRVSNDSAYKQQRRRVTFLHRKLAHIKRMVRQYDHPECTQ